MDDWQELSDSAHRWQHASWALGAATGVGAIVTGILWYRATRVPQTRFEVNASGSGAAVSLSGSW